MHEKGLRPKTIRNHLENIRFFLIDFLLYYEGETMQEGIHSVSLFLGDWFIRKAAWSTEYSIKQNIASFKKFYKCMHEKGNISKEDYDYLLQTIKEDKNEWIEDVNQYNYDFDSWYDKYYDF